MVSGDYCIINAVNRAGWRAGGQRKRVWEHEGGSQRRAGLAEEEVAGIGVAGDEEGLGRHMGSPGALWGWKGRWSERRVLEKCKADLKPQFS